MNKYQLDPNVCPSSLNENCEPMTEGETAHVWDTTTDTVTCNECGATREPMTKEKVLEVIEYVFSEGATSDEEQVQMVEIERYLKANLN